MKKIAILLLLLAGAALSKDHYIFHLYTDKEKVEYLYTDFSQAHYPRVRGDQEMQDEAKEFIKMCENCKVSLFILERDKYGHNTKTTLKSFYYLNGKEQKKYRSRKTFYDDQNENNVELYDYQWEKLQKNLTPSDRINIITYGHLDSRDPFSIQSFNYLIGKFIDHSFSLHSLVLQICYGQDIIDQIPTEYLPVKIDVSSDVRHLKPMSAQQYFLKAN